jgi:hypothetical protein
VAWLPAAVTGSCAASSRRPSGALLGGFVREAEAALRLAPRGCLAVAGAGRRQRRLGAPGGLGTA